MTSEESSHPSSAIQITGTKFSDQSPVAGCFVDMALQVEADLPANLACLKVSCIILNVHVLRTWRFVTLCFS